MAPGLGGPAGLQVTLPAFDRNLNRKLWCFARIEGKFHRSLALPLVPEAHDARIIRIKLFGLSQAPGGVGFFP